MKEKRGSSDSLSGCGCFGVLCAAVISLCSIFWIGTIIPYNLTARFDVRQTKWDATQEELFFARSSKKSFYTLDRAGFLTCQYERPRAQPPVQSLAPAQFAALENRYGAIESYDVVAKDVVVLIISKPMQFIGLPFSVYNSELVLVRNINNGDAVTIDASLLYKADQQCGVPSYLAPMMLFLAGITFSIGVIQALRHRIRWLCLFLICLPVSYFAGYILSFSRGLGSDF